MDTIQEQETINYDQPNFKFLTQKEYRSELEKIFNVNLFETGPESKETSKIICSTCGENHTKKKSFDF